MIDNPLPDQVVAEKEADLTASELEEYSKTHGVEIAKHFKVHPDLHDEFAEWYHDYVSQNPHLFDFTTIYLDQTYIREWWTADSYLYDDFLSPYQRTKFK